MMAHGAGGRETFDIAIVGGGLAGLSLAARLAGTRFAHWRIAIIEPRDAYRRDRTWSSWAVQPHAFSSAHAARWQKWQVMRQLDREDVTGRARALPGMTECAGSYAYEMVPSDRFYDAAVKMIADAPHISFLRGVAVDEIVERNDAAPIIIHTDSHEIGARLIFDARPPAALSTSAWMQYFQGGEIETATPVFDVDCATVMDFSVMSADDARKGRVHFIYVLPLANNRALIQDTFFVPAADRCADVDYHANIDQYLKRRFGVSTYSRVYDEGGAIPMDPDLRPSTHMARVIKVGTAGGMARASSGYAFFETQRACDAIADALATASSIDRGFTLPQWRSSMSYWMDGVFLRVLRDHPALAPTIFARLFYRVPSDALARFLAGIGSTADVLKVMMACPKWPFIKAAFIANN